MTEKRFTYENHKVKDNLTGETHSSNMVSVNVLNALHEENQNLKKENMEYYHLINCGNCKHHNYDWYDDGDEFEVCEKGNNERLMYNKFCKNWEGD